MKTILLFGSFLLFALPYEIMTDLNISTKNRIEKATSDVSLLLGEWKLDLSPLDFADYNFAEMSRQGIFYWIFL